MATLWLTYSWQDNADQDVDFIAQQIIKAGVNVKLDRWSVIAGQRLWEQIDSFISNPQECDAWALYATQASLGSQPCREELAYALDRALGIRGASFPIIAIFPTKLDANLVPASIRTRLYVSLSDPDWKERVVAAAQGKTFTTSTNQIEPYSIRWHPAPPPFQAVAEVRPRAGTWYPFVAVIPASERERVGLAVRSGPCSRVPPLEGVVISGGSGPMGEKEWYGEYGYEDANPARSYYLFFKDMPSKFGFGQPDTPGQLFVMTISGSFPLS